MAGAFTLPTPVSAGMPFRHMIINVTLHIQYDMECSIRFATADDAALTTVPQPAITLTKVSNIITATTVAVTAKQQQ